MKRFPSVPTRCLAIAATLLSLALVGHPAAAKGKATPVARHLEALTVGNAREFRLAIVHPLYAPRFLSESFGLGPAAKTPPDALGLAVRKTRVDLSNFQESRLLVLPGEMIRGPRADFTALEYVINDGVGGVQLGVRKISADDPSSAPAVEPRVVGGMLPPTLRWTALDAPAKALRRATLAWSKGAELETDRRSPSELAGAKLLAERVASYEKALVKTSKPPAGTELVGYGLLIDADLTMVESFRSKELFDHYWPAQLRALSVECAMLELQQELIDQEIPAPGDPDRFVAKIKERFVSLYGARPKIQPVREIGRVYLLDGRGDARARALEIDDRIVHLLLMVRPDRRKAPDPDETQGFGYLARKVRPTEADKRHVERRERLGLKPPTTPPVPPPTGD